MSSLETLMLLLEADISVYHRKFFNFIKRFKCHIKETPEEFEDHNLLSIPDFNKPYLFLVICFRLNLENIYRRLNIVCHCK